MTAEAIVLVGVVSIGLLESGLRLAVPILLPAIGEAVSQRAGVINIGLEGMMMVGAFTGFAVVSSGHPVWAGYLAATGAGAALAVLMIVNTVLRAGDQIVTGFAITLLGVGLANFLYGQTQEDLSSFTPADKLALGPFADIPYAGQIAFHQPAVVYLALLLGAGAWAFLRQARVGLAVDAAGSDPVAAAAKGVNVRRTRAGAVLMAGCCAGLGGATISVSAVGNFSPDITAGRGFVAVALVALARRGSLAVIPAALAFGLLDALQVRLQGSSGVPVELLPALPWVMIVVVFVVLGKGYLRRDTRRSRQEAT
jgi:ABC-type uncharacterized transport system permease subunit